MEKKSLEMFNQTVNYEHELIWVKPVCDLFNLNIRNQYRKIQNDPILGNLRTKKYADLPKNPKNDLILDNLRTKKYADLTKTDTKEPFLDKLVGKNTPDLGEIDENGRILLTKKGFLRWIQIINVNTIEASLRDKFIQYQIMIFDYIYDPMFERKDVLTEKAKVSQRIGQKRDILNDNTDYVDLINLQAEEMRLGKLLKDIDRDVVNTQKGLWDQDFLNKNTPI